MRGVRADSEAAAHWQRKVLLLTVDFLYVLVLPLQLQHLPTWLAAAILVQAAEHEPVEVLASSSRP